MNPRQIFSKGSKYIVDQSKPIFGEMQKNIDLVRSGDRNAINKMTSDIVGQYMAMGVTTPVSKIATPVQVARKALRSIGPSLRGAIVDLSEGKIPLTIDDVNNLNPIFDRVMADAGKRTLSKLPFSEKLREVATQVKPKKDILDGIKIFLRNK